MKLVDLMGVKLIWTDDLNSFRRVVTTEFGVSFIIDEMDLKQNGIQAELTLCTLPIRQSTLNPLLLLEIEL